MSEEGTWVSRDELLKLKAWHKAEAAEAAELRERVKSAVVDSIWMPSEDHPEDTVVIFTNKDGWEQLVEIAQANAQANAQAKQGGAKRSEAGPEGDERG